MADIDSDSNSTIIQIGPSANLLSSSSVNPLLPSEIDLEHANQVESTSNHNSGSDLVQSSQSGQMSDDEPSLKKIKLNHNNIVDISCGGVLDGHGIAVHEKLEQRLGGILCCAVCLDLPKTAMYQCQMGHLMCAACFSHLLADSRLRDQSATCPNCRVEISKSTAFRNLAVEKAVSELPSECPYCYNEFPHKLRSFHEQNYCQERPTRCVYNRIGCPWMGPYHESFEHEQNCSHPRKSGFEVMAALDIHDAKIKDEQKVFTNLIDLLSFEKIIFNDLQFKPYRTEEFSTKLYYETSRFSAFNQQWLVKARINNSQRNPHQTNERQLSYQLVAKSKPIIPISIFFFALKGPFSDMKVDTKIYRHDYTENSNESEYNLLPLPDNFECNRLLSSKGINFRLLMFLHSK